MNPSQLPFEPIKKLNLNQMLVEYLIEQIENGSYPISERIPNEVQLASQLNVSRNILRESIKILESYGVLQTLNGRGTIVAPGATACIHSMRFFEKLRKDTNALQLLEARLILEPRIAYFACERCTTEDIAHLESIISAPPEEIAASGHADDYDFHLAVARICGNDTLYDFLYTMISHLRSGDYSQFDSHVENMLSQKSYREHKDIVDSFSNYNPEASSRIMEKHLRDRISIIKSLYQPALNASTLQMDELLQAMHSSL